MISADHIEHASESEPSDYENCSRNSASFGTDVGHLPMKPYNYACNMQSSTLLKMWIHFCGFITIESDG